MHYYSNDNMAYLSAWQTTDIKFEAMTREFTPGLTPRFASNFTPGLTPGLTPGFAPNFTRHLTSFSVFCENDERLCARRHTQKLYEIYKNLYEYVYDN